MCIFYRLRSKFHMREYIMALDHTCIFLLIIIYIHEFEHWSITQNILSYIITTKNNSHVCFKVCVCVWMYVYIYNNFKYKRLVILNENVCNFCLKCCFFFLEKVKLLEGRNIYLCIFIMCQFHFFLLCVSKNECKFDKLFIRKILVIFFLNFFDY